MMCYRDRTFCSAACATMTCPRFVDDAVRAAAEREGLPLALSDLSVGCMRYRPDPAPKPEGTRDA